jgi:hypothetical protein
MTDLIFQDERAESEAEKGTMPMLAQGADSDPTTIAEVEAESLREMGRWRRMGILFVLNTVTMIAAFDATSICVILPVSSPYKIYQPLLTWYRPWPDNSMPRSR